jgi:DNA-binding response OmpR family regulator
MIMHNLLTPPEQPRSSAPTHAPLFIIGKDSNIVQMLTLMLELAGYRSIKSTNALSTLSSHSPQQKPALILLDMGLIYGSGRKMLLDIQKHCSSLRITTPIIILTTSPALQKEAGSMGYRAILKPFSLQDLMQAVREALCPPLLQQQAFLK